MTEIPRKYDLVEVVIGKFIYVGLVDEVWDNKVKVWLGNGIIVTVLQHEISEIVPFHQGADSPANFAEFITREKILAAQETRDMLEKAGD